MAIDVLIDDNGVKAEFFDRIFGLGKGELYVLQRSGGDSDELLGIGLQNSCKGLVERSADAGAHGAVDVR